MSEFHSLQHHTLQVPRSSMMMLRQVSSILGVLALAALLGLAHAQPSAPVNNYFGNLTAEQRQLLRDNEQVHLEKGLRHLATRKPHELEYAKGEFHYILARWPNHPKALDGMLTTATLLKQPQLAQKYADAAIAIAPDEAQTYLIVGMFYMRSSQNELAEAMLRKAVELNPNSLNGHYSLGLLYAQTKRLELANEHAQKAYALGHPLPGLRKRLQEAGAWKPISESTKAPEETTSMPARRQ